MLLPIYTESASQEQHSKAVTLFNGIAMLTTTERGTGSSKAMEVQHFDIFAWAHNDRERTCVPEFGYADHFARWDSPAEIPCAWQVYGLYVGLLLGALNRLPIKLPRKGAGRRHSGAGSSGTSPQHVITFSDVAGVDEAKEELSEIVVRAPALPRCHMTDQPLRLFA